MSNDIWNRIKTKVAVVTWRPRFWLWKARDWSARNRGATAAIAGLMLLAVPVAGVLMLSSSQQTSRPVTPQAPLITVDQALEALDRGDTNRARKLAEKLRTGGAAVFPPSGPAFVLGVIAAHEADDFFGKERKQHALQAIRYLEEARAMGFPEERAGDGLYLLGKSLVTVGRLKESRPILNEALDQDALEVADIHRLLSLAYRHGEDSDTAKAKEHIEQYLDLADLDDAALHAGLLALSELLWELQDYDACRETLEKIPSTATVFAVAGTLRGGILLDEARAAKKSLPADATTEQRAAVNEKYDEAIAVLRKAQTDPFETEAVRKSMYQIGLCLLEREDTRAALAQFARTRDLFIDTPEGLAAGLQEAELLRSMNRHEEALETYAITLAAVGDPAEFINPWVPLDKFRKRVLEAYQQYLEARQFDRAIELAGHLTPLFPPSKSLQLAAEANRTWAELLGAQADSTTDTSSAATRAQSRKLMRQAGRQFSELAQLEYSTRRYPDDLWQAAQCYLAGQDFVAAGKAFENYMQHELKSRRAPALVGFGQALLAQQRYTEALTALSECIEFHSTDAVSFRARILASKIYLESGEPDKAEKLLMENLDGDRLTPASKEWRDSLFMLGKLLAMSNRHDDAIQILEEAVSRYPETRDAIQARYTIAESYRLAASAFQQKLESDTIETTKSAHRRQIQQYLGAAVQNYEQLQQALNRRQETAELSPLEKANLRNSYFAVGAALFDLGRFEEAIKAYSIATNRYQHDPEVLEALVQIASCYRRLNKPLEARGALQQAKLVINRIPQDAAFTQTTNYSRREWQDMLDWLSTL